MSWSFSMGSEPQETTKKRGKTTSQQGPDDLLRQEAEEFLGPERSLDDLEVWEQRALLAEIEGDFLQLPLQTVYDAERYPRETKTGEQVQVAQSRSLAPPTYCVIAGQGSARKIKLKKLRCQVYAGRE